MLLVTIGIVNLDLTMSSFPLELFSRAMVGQTLRIVQLLLARMDKEW